MCSRSWTGCGSTRVSRRNGRTRRFRGAQYCITVENPDGAEHGVRELYVDGVRQDGNLIAPAAPGSVVSVRVVLGG